jgi:hypothetical protein
VEAFYLQRVIAPAPDGCPLILTFDGKGIVMLPQALRPATAKAAASAQGKLATRLSPGEKNGRKRMAELACVYDAVPVPRTPEDVISTPAQKRRKKTAQAGKPKGRGKPREPQARGKWLTASVTDDIPAVIAAAFDEAERRDPGHQREWVVLIDGNNTQIEAVTAEAARRGVTVTIIIDFIHVIEYCWKAAWSFIEGACRFVIEDRFGITGARWSPDGADVILKLRAVVVNGDLDDYMTYYKQRYREDIHLTRYDPASIPGLGLTA